MERRKYVLALIESIVGDAPTAEMVLDRLQEEGFLHLGFGNRDVDLIVGTFADLWGTTKTTKYDRFAATRLAKSDRYGGAEGIVGLLKLYHSLSTDKYAPSVSSVVQLEEKLPAIVNFLRKKGQEGEVVQL